MRHKSLLLALLAFPLCAANTQIVDTVRYLNGTLASCTFSIYGPVSTANVGIATTAGDGSSVTPTTYTYQVVAGILNVSLHPNDDLTPSGTTYRVTRSCRPPGPQSVVEYWSVPTSSTPLTISGVLVSTTSTSTIAYGQIRGLTLGDLLYGGSTGYATRLPRPSDGTYSLTFTAGIPSYTSASSSSLPSMTGQSGKYLTNNGSAASWATVSSGSPSVGLVTAVQSADGVGGFADTGCTAATGAIVCAEGVSTSTLLGTSSFAWSLITGPLASGNAVDRPACSSAGYYLATDTHALTRCDGAAWSSTLNPSGAIACIVDSVADAFQCYDSSGAALNVPATRTVAGHALSADVTVSKADVGLANVDNTSDANKPVSTATQTALDLKENLANKSTATALGTSDTLYPTQNAVKAYVDAHAGSGTVTSVGVAGTANQITVTGASPITSSGSFTLSIPTNPTLPGTTTGTFSGALTGNASTATALASNGTNCSAGSFPLGVDASGNAETCTALPTTITGTANQITASASTGAITLSIPTNPTLPGTTTGTFSGNLTGNVTGTASGNVTTTGTMTSGALVTSNGTSVVKTPSATATLDASGNMSLPGTLTIGTTVTLDGTTNGITTASKLGGVTLSGLTGLTKLTAGVPSVASAADIPAVALPTPGATCSMSGNSTFCVCTTTCTVTPSAPAAGTQLCAVNDIGVSTVITLAALGSGNYYSKSDRSAYGTVNSTLVSGGAVGDSVCIFGRDATHYIVASSNGTWTAN